MGRRRRSDPYLYLDCAAVIGSGICYSDCVCGNLALERYDPGVYVSEKGLPIGGDAGQDHNDPCIIRLLRYKTPGGDIHIDGKLPAVYTAGSCAIYDPSALVYREYRSCGNKRIAQKGEGEVVR